MYLEEFLYELMVKIVHFFAESAKWAKANAKLAIKRLEEYVAIQNQKEAERISQQQEVIRKEQQLQQEDQIKELLATAMNEMPDSKRIFGVVSEHSLRLEMTSSSTVKLVLSSLLLEEESPAFLRGFNRTLEETVASVHRNALRQLEEQIDNDRAELRSKIIDAQHQNCIDEKADSYFQRDITRIENDLQNRYARLYTQLCPRMYFIENVISIEYVDGIEVTFDLYYDDKGLGINNYQNRIKYY